MGDAVRLFQIVNLLNNRPEAQAMRDHLLALVGVSVDWVEDMLQDRLREHLLDHLEECGCCSCYHRPEFRGDCRNDAERF